MFISILFSVSLYEVSVHQLNSRLRQQTLYLMPGMQDVNKEINTQEALGAHDLLIDLIYFNVIILVAATTASYLLAKQTLEPIEEAHETQKRFAADASHELRTPLTAMKAEIEVALRDSNMSPPDYRQLLASNLEEVDRLVTLTNVLLEIARHGEHGGLSKTMEAVDMAEVVNDARTHVSKIAKQRDIALAVESVPIRVMGDKAGLTELLVIFLDNAIKYSPEHSQVHIGLSRKGNQALVTILDSGIGIAREDLMHVFDRFYRADHSRSLEKTKGFGLGLSLAKLIADRHNGRIVIESEQGKGTLVRLELPLMTASQPS